MPRDESTSPGRGQSAQPSLAEDLALARRLADLAARISLEYQRRGVVTEKKADGSIVTDADREVERALRAIVAAERPDDALLGEELGASGESSRRWIFDPIDGTSNFVSGKPEWGNHIALEQDGRIVLGIITRPLLGRLWWATRGGGAHRARLASTEAAVTIRVSTRSALREARVSLWAPAGDARVLRLQRDASWQAPNLDAVLRVAQGELEAVVDPTAKAWDHAPGVIIVEEAGGRFSDRFGGSRIDLGEGRFSNGHIHAELMSALDS